jgi:hypothetical protein
VQRYLQLYGTDKSNDLIAAYVKSFSTRRAPLVLGRTLAWPHRMANVFNDAIPWHLRVLLIQIERERWIWGALDLDVQQGNLADFRFKIIGRDEVVALDCRQLYNFCFPVEVADMNRMRTQVLRIASVLGVEGPAGQGPAVARNSKCILSDTADEKIQRAVNRNLQNPDFDGLEVHR